MPFGIGATELILLLVILLVVFGAKRLPEIGRGLGSSAREFRDGLGGGKDEEPPHLDDGESLTGPPTTEHKDARQPVGKPNDPS